MVNSMGLETPVNIFRSLGSQGGLPYITLASWHFPFVICHLSFVIEEMQFNQ
jgi:hypothetical protein